MQEKITFTLASISDTSIVTLSIKLQSLKICLSDYRIDSADYLESVFFHKFGSKIFVKSYID